MTRIGVFAAFTLLMPVFGIDAAPRPPLVLDNDTVAVTSATQASTLLLPQGTGPFPAVIVLHGCNGINDNMRVWARRLVSWGYAALILDSFTPRGIVSVCGNGRQFPGRERAADVFAAAGFLRSRPDIDPARIGVIGFSHGASTAFAAAIARIVRANGARPFPAIVAYYPYCIDGTPPLASDVQILIGSSDDWTPARRCTALHARYAAAATHAPLLKTYRGAYHVFDVKAPKRVFFGHRLEYNAKAAADSFDVARRFFDSRLKPAGLQ